MICSNSLYHGDEQEQEYDRKIIKELKDYENEEKGVQEWKDARED